MPNARTGYLTETDRVIRKVEYLKWVATNVEFSTFDKRMFNFLKTLSKKQPLIIRKLKFVPNNRSNLVRMTIASEGISPSGSVCEIVDNRERPNGRVLRIEHDHNQMLNFIIHCTDDIYVEMLYPGQDFCEMLFSVIEYSPDVDENVQMQYLFARDAEKLLNGVISGNVENVLKARVDNALDSKDPEKFILATTDLKKYLARKAKKAKAE